MLAGPGRASSSQGVKVSLCFRVYFFGGVVAEGDGESGSGVCVCVVRLMLTVSVHF
jgi:hypothetical protein